MLCNAMRLSSQHNRDIKIIRFSYLKFIGTVRDYNFKMLDDCFVVAGGS